MKEGKTLIETGWNFDNSYATLPNSFYSILNPTPVTSPNLAILNHDLAQSLGLNVEELQKEDGVAVLAGNLIPEGALPIAQAYAGHQFGHFTMLGDGRAILIGEQITPKGKRFDIQYKGSGRTPYSRGGDGRAALGPMLREYIISEAMYALGIPTTRSLGVVTTGEWVMRETKLPGAVLTRVASSHIRVGTFQYVSKWCKFEELKAMADYTINRHFPEVKDNENPYLSFLHEVIRHQAMLISKWQLVGFVHGVMNTDNMAICGETIDFGPCAFMDTYDPATVFSSIDANGRYAYSNQPKIAAWNLARFAETLLPLIHDNMDEAVKLAQEKITGFPELYHLNWLEGMREKLGITNHEVQDESLIEELLQMMRKHNADYTNTFRALTYDTKEGIEFFNTLEFTKWSEKWRARLKRQEGKENIIKQLMISSNPAIIPRNHRVEEALEAAEKHGDYSVMKRLLDAICNPYVRSTKSDEYSLPPEPSNCPYRTFCGT